MLEDYTAIDLEMTGLNAKWDAIVEVGGVRVRRHRIVDTYGALLRVERKIPPEVAELTGITDEMLREGRAPAEAMAEFFEFLGEDVLVGHNVIFDYSFLKQWAANHDLPFERSAADTLKLARHFLPKEQKKDLESLCAYFSIERRNAHRALDDALETAQIFERMQERCGAQEPEAFVPKPLLYRVKKLSPATARQREYIRRFGAYYGVAEHEGMCLSALPEDLTRSGASKLCDRLIAQYGRLPEK